jgi:peptidoglycan/LPS O-acetylase OafA/YrhL
MRHLVNFGNHWDLSYGIHILHFPVIQWRVSIGLDREGPFGALAQTLIAVRLLARGSWPLVEKPSLRITSHLAVTERR